MDNLTDLQKTVLDTLLPPLKKTVPEKELKRVCRVYKELIENNDDDSCMRPSVNLLSLIYFLY